MPYKCKEMRAISSRKWYVKNIHRKMHDGAKRRAKKANIPFNITIQDIKDVFPNDWICPALGVKMEVATGKNNELSPTLDRIVPDYGYVKGNIMVISYRANGIKSNAVPSEIKSVYDYVVKKYWKAIEYFAEHNIDPPSSTIRVGRERNVLLQLQNIDTEDLY